MTAKETLQAPQVYCLCISGPGLTDDDRTMLFVTAQEMARRGRYRKRVKTENMDGMVETMYEFDMVNSWLAGIRFHATLEMESGRKEVKFLVRPTALNLDRLSWTELPPGHPLLRFEDPERN